MATQLSAPIPSRRLPRAGIGRWKYLPKALALSLLNFFCSILVQPQFPTPLVFSSGGAVVLRNDQTGALTPVPGSPFAAAGQKLTLDVQGRFLFCTGNNSIHMFQILDATTGAYREVANSPFASTNTKDPGFIAVEPTGQFIAVVNFVGENPGESLVETFQIAPSAPGGPSLVPVAGSATPLVSTPVSGGTAQPSGAQKFLVYMGPNIFSSDPTIRGGEDFESITIDPVSGNLLGVQNVADSSTGRTSAIDPQGRFIILGHGDRQGVLELRPIAPGFLRTVFLLPQGIFPDEMYVDSSGAFLYVSYTP